MFRKIEKAKRYWSWRLKATENVPLFWHIGRPNFGDDINPSFMQELCGRPIRFAIDQSKPHLLGTGSILESATHASIVVGSGYLKATSGPLPEQTKVISVRGQQSLELAETDGNVLLGDPLVLVNKLFDKPIKKKHRLGLVAHVLNMKQMKAKFGQHAHIISPALEPWEVVREIASCEQIVSQSLHGLIVADAFAVPNLWLAPSDSMMGGRFKFDDYFTTLDNSKPSIDESLDIFQHPSQYPFSACQYKYSKSEYRAALTKALVPLSTSTHKADGDAQAWESQYSLTK